MVEKLFKMQEIYTYSNILKKKSIKFILFFNNRTTIKINQPGIIKPGRAPWLNQAVKLPATAIILDPVPISCFPEHEAVYIII